MVQIKLAIAFILAAATIAPVVAIPVNTIYNAKPSEEPPKSIPKYVHLPPQDTRPQKNNGRGR
jgi:hypothetical protein